MLCIPGRIWTWKQWNTNASRWTDSLLFCKHPRRIPFALNCLNHCRALGPSNPQGKSIYPVLLQCFSTLPLFSVLCDQHKVWTLPLLAVLPGHLSSPAVSCTDQQTVPLLPSGADALWPLFMGPHCRPHRCPSRTLVNSCERLPILAYIKGRPENASRSISS